MGRLSEYLGIDVAFGVFIALFVISRVTSRSALKLLDDESKIKLVDASSRSNWWLLPLIPILFLLYWRIPIGALALFAYLVVGMIYNVWWHHQNHMPKRFVTRIVVSYCIILIGFLALAFGYVADTA